MQKALIITPFYKSALGGAESFTEDLAKELSKKYIVHISTVKWKKPVVWEGTNPFKAFIILARLFYGTFKVTAVYDYEKIYALGLISACLCWLMRLKFSTIILALYDFKKPSWYRFFLNKAEKVFVEGFNGKQDVIKAGVKEDKITVFQHWADLNKFCFIEKNNPRIKVLFIGRPIWIKGKHIIEECEKLTTNIDYEYISNVPHQDMPKYYQMADVVVVPSLYSEGFLKVVAEAAACGCAVITSNLGSLPEMVNNFGKTIEPTPGNFARELNTLKNNRVALEKLQINTTLYALKHFSPKNAEVFYADKLDTRGVLV